MTLETTQMMAHTYPERIVTVMTALMMMKIMTMMIMMAMRGPDCDDDGPPEDNDNHSDDARGNSSDHGDEDGDDDEQSHLSEPPPVTPDAEDDTTSQASSQQGDGPDPPSQGASDMRGPTPEKQGVTDIDPSPAPNNQGVMDADEESDQEDLTKSHAFREAEDRGCAAAEDDTHQWSRRTHKPQQDPAYEYINHLLDGMDPEAVFTFLTREDSVTMLTFLTAQMSANGSKKLELILSCQNWNS